MIQGLLELIWGDPLLLQQELANANGHEFENYPLMTRLVNS
jgi:hypothetical protein